MLHHFEEVDGNGFQVQVKLTSLDLSYWRTSQSFNTMAIGKRIKIQEDMVANLENKVTFLFIYFQETHVNDEW